MQAYSFHISRVSQRGNFFARCLLMSAASARVRRVARYAPTTITAGQSAQQHFSDADARCRRERRNRAYRHH